MIQMTVRIGADKRYQLQVRQGRGEGETSTPINVEEGSEVYARTRAMLEDLGYEPRGEGVLPDDEVQPRWGS